MSAIALKSAWKYKIDPTNIFNDNFLKEKDSALQPIDFFLENKILISNNDINNNKNISINNDEINNNKKESDIYDSNIIIIKEQSDDDTEFTSFNNKFGKEIEKINSMMLPKMKKKKKIQKNRISFKPIKY